MNTPCAHCKVVDSVVVCVMDDRPGAWVPFSEHYQMLARVEAALAEAERLSALATLLLQSLQKAIQK